MSSPKITMSIVLDAWSRQTKEPKQSPIAMARRLEEFTGPIVFDRKSEELLPYLRKFTESEMDEFLEYYYNTCVSQCDCLLSNAKSIYEVLVDNNLLTFDQACQIIEDLDSMDYTPQSNSNYATARTKLFSYLVSKKQEINWNAKYEELQAQSQQTEAKLMQEIAALKEQSEMVIIPNEQESQKIKELEEKLKKVELAAIQAGVDTGVQFAETIHTKDEQIKSLQAKLEAAEKLTTQLSNDLVMKVNQIQERDTQIQQLKAEIDGRIALAEYQQTINDSLSKKIEIRNSIIQQQQTRLIEVHEALNKVLENCQI